MRVFLWIFLVFSIIILKRAIVYQPLSLVFCFPLKAGLPLTAGSLWLAFGQGCLHRGMDALLSLQIESLCSAMLVCWGFCWDRPADLKSCDGPLAGPALPALSKQPDLSLAPHASCLSSPAAGEWFQHSDPHCSGTGLWLLRKAGFFSDPASCQHGACPSPARGVSSHSGWVSMSLLMRCWARELRQAGAEQALFNQCLKSRLQLRQLICNGSRQDKLRYKSLRMCYSAGLSVFTLAASDRWDLLN